MAEETKQLSLNIDAKQIQLIMQQAVRRASTFMAIGVGTAKSASLTSLKLDPDFPVAFTPSRPARSCC